MNLEPYDAGLLGGDDDSPTCWWHEYIRSELAAAHDFYQQQAEATPAVQGEPVAWSGWGCQYPGKMPRLYGDRRIAELNCDWENGDQVLHFTAAPQPPAAPDVAKLQRNVSEAHKREEALEAYIRELQSRKFVKFAGEECWVWQSDGSDSLETLVCPVVIRPGDLMEIINCPQTAPDVAGLAGKMRMLIAAGNRLNAEAEECTYEDGVAEVASVEFWSEFRDALEAATEALAAQRKGGE